MLSLQDREADGVVAVALADEVAFGKLCGALKGKAYLYFRSGEGRKLQALLELMKKFRRECRTGTRASHYEDLICTLLVYLAFEAGLRGRVAEQCRLAHFILSALRTGDERRSACGEEAWGNSELRLAVYVGMTESFVLAQRECRRNGWDSRALRVSLAEVASRLHSALTRLDDVSPAAQHSLKAQLCSAWLALLKLDLLHGDPPREGIVAAINRECGLDLLHDARHWREGCDHVLVIEYVLAGCLLTRPIDSEEVLEVLARRERMIESCCAGSEWRDRRADRLEIAQVARLLGRCSRRQA